MNLDTLNLSKKMNNFKKDRDVIKILLQEKNPNLIHHIKDVNSFIYTYFNVNNSDTILKIFVNTNNNILNKYKKGLLKQIFRFIHIRPDIIKYSKKIIVCKYEYNDFIWKCLKKKTMNIIPYIDISKKLNDKIFTLNEHKVNEFIYNIVTHDSIPYITDEYILNNINKYPRLIYLCSAKTLRNIQYMKQILHKLKYFECKYKIILDYLFDNSLPIIHDYSMLELINNIDCRYLNLYIENFDIIINNVLIKKLLYKCSCCLKFYDINYNNIHLIYELIKLNVDTLDYIDLNLIKIEKDIFLYNCCDINIHCIKYFIKKKYNICLEKYKKILDINYTVIHLIQDENIRNKLILYYYQNNYFIYNEQEIFNNEFIDIKNFHVAIFKKNIFPIEIKKNIYSYLYNIE